MTKLYTQTIDELSVCYDTHADKFSSTRKKNRPELDYIVQHLLSQYESTPQGLSIVELGCGDGRLFGYIQQLYPNLIKTYTGVDISANLLNIAKKKFSDTKAERIQDDMIHYVSVCDDTSIDVVICMASFQHLPDLPSRTLLLHHIYRILIYDGALCSVDRSWSLWMIQRHGRLLRTSLKKKITTRGKREWNNLLIPFTDKGLTHQRLYHIFTLIELRALLDSHGFYGGSYIYSSQDGSFHHNILKARNICTYVQKRVLCDDVRKK